MRSLNEVPATVQNDCQAEVSIADQLFARLAVATQEAHTPRT